MGIQNEERVEKEERKKRKRGLRNQIYRLSLKSASIIRHLTSHVRTWTVATQFFQSPLSKMDEWFAFEALVYYQAETFEFCYDSGPWIKTTLV
jgi:hypothetical protein